MRQPQTSEPAGAAVQSDLPRIPLSAGTHFDVQYALQKITRYLEAVGFTRKARANGANSEVIRKLETVERHATYHMKCAVDLLHESLNPSDSKQERQCPLHLKLHLSSASRRPSVQP